MRIVGCHQGCCILGHSCYDDQLLWSLVVAFWWFMVVVQLVVIWDCLHKQWRYYEDHWLLSCYFGNSGGDGCVPQDNFQISALCRIGLTLHRNRMSRCAASCQGEDCHAEKWESQSTSFIHIFLLGWKSSYADNLREKVIENLLQNLQSRNQNRHPHAR